MIPNNPTHLQLSESVLLALIPRMNLASPNPLLECSNDKDLAKRAANLATWIILYSKDEVREYLVGVDNV